MNLKLLSLCIIVFSISISASEQVTEQENMLQAQSSDCLWLQKAEPTSTAEFIGLDNARLIHLTKCTHANCALRAERIRKENILLSFTRNSAQKPQDVS